MAKTSLPPHLQLFLELLNDASWGRQKARLSQLSPRVWDHLWQVATEQGVPALIADELLAHHSEVLSMPIAIELMEVIRAVEDKNRQINDSLVAIDRAMQLRGVPYMILKGPISGNNYPRPALRVPGDIDLYIWEPKATETALQWLTEYATEEITEGVSDHERAFLLPNGIKLELHHQLLFLHRKRYNGLFNRLVSEAIVTHQLSTLAIPPIEVQTLPTTLNALYLFIHLFSHFLYTGIGLRQVYDWLLFLKQQKARIAPELYYSVATELKLLKAMQAFARVGIDYFGAEVSYFPFEVPECQPLAAKIVADIFEGGNFGLHDAAHTIQGHQWRRNLRLTTSIFQRSARFYSLAPHYYLGAALYKVIEGLKPKALSTHPTHRAKES